MTKPAPDAFSKPARIAFFGSDPIALPMLDALFEMPQQVEFAGVWTQPDRRQGRGMKCVANAIKQWAEAHKLPVRQPATIAEEDLAWLHCQAVELVIVMAYGHILKRRVLEIPSLGTINLHGSILPKYRGASPIETAIAEGEPYTGVSLMRIVPKMDAGPVLDVQAVSITTEDTGATLREKLAQACVPLLHRTLPQILDGSALFVEQDHTAATYCRRLTKDDAILDFNATPEKLCNRIRAFTPWPGAVCHHGQTPLKIGGVSACSPTEYPAIQAPGTVLDASTQGVKVATKPGTAITISHLQRPGGKMLTAAEFLRGYPLKHGDILTGGQWTQLLSPAKA